MIATTNFSIWLTVVNGVKWSLKTYNWLNLRRGNGRARALIEQCKRKWWLMNMALNEIPNSQLYEPNKASSYSAQLSVHERQTFVEQPRIKLQQWHILYDYDPKYFCTIILYCEYHNRILSARYLLCNKSDKEWSFIKLSFNKLFNNID